jgi:hypothetical protein
MSANHVNGEIERIVEHAIAAAEGKAKELVHAAKIEEYSAVIQDPEASITEKIAAAGHVVVEKIQEWAGKREYEANKDALLHQHSEQFTDSAISAAVLAVEGKKKEAKHHHEEEELHALIDDTAQPLETRMAAVVGAATEKLKEFEGLAQFESNKDTLRQAILSDLAEQAADGKTKELVHAAAKETFIATSHDTSLPLRERVAAAVAAEAEEELEHDGHAQYESNKRRCCMADPHFDFEMFRA